MARSIVALADAQRTHSIEGPFSAVGAPLVQCEHHLEMVLRDSHGRYDREHGYLVSALSANQLQIAALQRINIGKQSSGCSSTAFDASSRASTLSTRESDSPRGMARIISESVARFSADASFLTASRHTALPPKCMNELGSHRVHPPVQLCSGSVIVFRAGLVRRTEERCRGSSVHSSAVRKLLWIQRRLRDHKLGRARRP